MNMIKFTPGVGKGGGHIRGKSEELKEISFEKLCSFNDTKNTYPVLESRILSFIFEDKYI